MTSVTQTSVNKKRYWLTLTLFRLTVWPRLVNVFHQEMNCNKNAGDCNKNVNILEYGKMLISHGSNVTSNVGSVLPSVSKHLDGSIFCTLIYEPRHEKTNKMSVRPARTQISLGISPV